MLSSKLSSNLNSNLKHPLFKILFLLAVPPFLKNQVLEIFKCKKALMKYDKEWRGSKMGKTIERNWHIKEYLIKLSDEKLNAIIHSAANLNLSEFSTFTLIKELIKVNPRLVVELGALAASLR